MFIRTFALFFFVSANILASDFNSEAFSQFRWKKIEYPNGEKVGILNSQNSSSPPMVFQISCIDKELKTYLEVDQQFNLQSQNSWVRVFYSTNFRPEKGNFIAMVRDNKLVLSKKDALQFLESYMETGLKKHTEVRVRSEEKEELGFIHLKRDKNGHVSSLLFNCGTGLHERHRRQY